MFGDFDEEADTKRLTGAQGKEAASPQRLPLWLLAIVCPAFTLLRAEGPEENRTLGLQHLLDPCCAGARLHGRHCFSVLPSLAQDEIR